MKTVTLLEGLMPSAMGFSVAMATTAVMNIKLIIKILATADIT